MMESISQFEFAKVNDHRLAYSQRPGNGATIILVHGITTYRFIWRKMIELFPTEYNVIALDLLGTGDSDKPLGVDVSLKAHAQILKGFLDSLGIDQCHLVGHDLGGGIAQIFAVRNPSFLLSLTLLNSVGYDLWPVQPIVAMQTPIIRQLMMAILDLGTFKFIVRRGLYGKKNFTDELMDYFWKPMKTPEGRKAFLQFAKCLDNNDLLEIESDLSRLAVPSLIIRGKNDLYLSENICRRLHAGIPASKLTILENAGHFIQEELPEELVTHIAEFIKNK